VNIGKFLRTRRNASLVGLALVVGLPLTAFFVAPASAAPGPPGADLAGINVTGAATAIQIAPLTPGVVGAGNVTQGNLVQASVPYASSSSSTGPSSSSVSSPVYPGPLASEMGTAFNTLHPLPPTFVNLLNDPVIARADYPAQVTAGTSGSYAPPGGSTTGVGTASAQAGPGGTSAAAATNDTTLAGQVEVGSSTAHSSTTIQAASASTDARTSVGTIKLLQGVIEIHGVSSDATASSNGSTGVDSSSMHVGAVTVAGQAAYIDSSGIHLARSDHNLVLVAIANQALTALQQAGISVTTIAPSEQQDGNAASVTSGGLQIAFLDTHIPSPQGLTPVNTIGLDVDLAISQASAQATALPPFALFPTAAAPVPPASPPVTSAVASSGVPATPATPSAVPTATQAPPSGGATVAAPPASPTPARSLPPPQPLPTEQVVLGLPVRVAWVVLALLVSIVISGPLLAYANWQLLRGRTL
jgi:hypothetical protein